MKNLRTSPRRSVRELARIIFEDGQPTLKCVILDVSESGARLMLTGAAALPETFLLFRRSDLTLREASVMRREFGSVGVKLAEPLDLESPRVKALTQLRSLSPIFWR
jgi:hypothetical protein